MQGSEHAPDNRHASTVPLLHGLARSGMTMPQPCTAIVGGQRSPPIWGGGGTPRHPVQGTHARCKEPTPRHPV